MKTRKVGKIVSLLVAIVLVATIMIPAASVLADSSEYAGVTWTEVGDFASLKKAFDKANSTGEKTYIRLTSDITLQRPYFNNDEINVEQTATRMHNWAKMYIYSTIRLTKIEEKISGDWVSGKKTTHDLEWLFAQAASPFNVSNPDAYFYGYTADDFNNGFLVKDGMQDYLGMGKKAGQGTGNDEKIGYEYSERMLVVDKNADITIDLYGKNMKASDYNPYDSTPKYQMSAIKVNEGGVLTVVDLSAEQTGSISGGTGNVYYKETVSTDNSEHTRDAMFNQDWTVRDTTRWLGWLSSTGRYNIEYQSKSTWVENAKESRGGGIYVENGGVFNLKSGKISGNQAFMESKNLEGKGIFAADVDPHSKGGGVFVEAGGTFNMSGGEISNNATRSFFKNWNNDRIYHAYAEGGGVYLEGSQEETVNGSTVTVPGAVFNMTGGKIVENAAYAQGGTGASSKSRITHSFGAGVYVGKGAVCNIKGSSSATSSTDIDMMKTFPQIVNNSCGGQVLKSANLANSAIEVKGGGIYNEGTVNIKNALITSNDFSEARQSDAKTAVHIMRDEDLPEDQRTITYTDGKTATLPGTGTDLALYILDYWEETSTETYGGGQKGIKQRPKTYITRLDNRFTDNLQLATEEVPHATSGIFGSVVVDDTMPIASDGAGVCISGDGKLVVGERTWITDNYDFLTNGHKAFAADRNYRRFWAQSKTIVDDRVYKTNDSDEKGATYTDPAGGWIYYGNENVNVNDGYAYSDTSDDVYLPEGAVIYKGGSLFESKIGINYWNMVNADGTAVEEERGLGQAGSQAGNRVIVATGKNLDTSFWGTSVTQPTVRDIQFFYANDNNKNWEKINYKLPTKKYWTSAGYKAFPVDPHLNWDNRARVAAISTTDSAINKDSSPYEGYVNYDVTYSKNKWKYGWGGKLDNSWDEETYRISDSHWTPSTNVKDPDSGSTDAELSRLTEFTNSSVNFPQRSYQLTAEMKKMNKSYLQAKYIDYKVVYDTTAFGTEKDPVLRFGKTDNDTRNMYVTVNFDEADKHYYGLENQSSFTLNDAVSTDSFTTAVNPFISNLDKNLNNKTFTFYGANKPQGTIEIAKVVPNYASYGKGGILADLRAASATADSSLSYDDAEKRNESPDLYFKGWQFYASYEYGPEIVTLDNKVEEKTVRLDNNSTLNYRGYFTADLSKIFNSNVNAQPCPSLTATWYTKEELAAARQNLSACKAQLILGTDGHIYIRVISVLGAYGEDRYNLQPIQASDANSSLRSLYYNAPTFVASKLNATPTLEGGYKATVNKGNIAAENYSARVVKKIICNDDEKNTFTIDIYDYISGNVSDENDIWVKFVNSNAAYKNANNSKSTTYVSFMWTNIDTGLKLADISNGSGYSAAAQEVLFVTPCIELTTDQAGKQHDSYYYGASRGFSIASLDAEDHNKLLEQAKTATN